MKFIALIAAAFAVLSVSAQTSDSPYDKEYGYEEGLCRVEYKGKFGYIDEKKREVIDLIYSSASDFHEGLAKVSLDSKKFGYINKQGKVVVPLEYEELMYGFNDGLSPAKKNGKWGMITDKGKTVIPHEFDNLYYPFEGLALAAKKSTNNQTLYGFIDEKGRTKIPFEYANAASFVDGVARVKKDNRFGFVNARGDVVIPIQYEAAEYFKEDLAAVKIGGRWGFINRENKLVIPAIYNKVTAFKSGEAEVLLGEKAFFIDKTAKKLPNGRWLLLFTKGLKTGEQFWYRGDDLSDPALKEKYSQGFRYYDIAQNTDKLEYFIIMSKFYTPWQSGVHHKYNNDQMWDKVKEFYKDGRNITTASYGQGKWSFIATDMGRNAQGVAVTNSSFPYTSIEKYWKEKKYITNTTYGDDKWLVSVRRMDYDDQIVEEFDYNIWDQEMVDGYAKKGYYITSLAKEKATTYVVFTKGSGIKDQLLLWSDDIPIREIKQYWDKGYQSYRTYYMPRNTTLDKSDYDFWF